LNAVCPDGFEYYFVDEEFVVGREFGLTIDIMLLGNYHNTLVATTNCLLFIGIQ
jgi:hypothetical protein